MRGSPHLFLAATPLWSCKQARVDLGMKAASASPAGHAAWHLRASRPKKPEQPQGQHPTRNAAGHTGEGTPAAAAQRHEQTLSQSNTGHEEQSLRGALTRRRPGRRGALVPLPRDALPLAWRSAANLCAVRLALIQCVDNCPEGATDPREPGEPSRGSFPLKSVCSSRLDGYRDPTHLTTYLETKKASPLHQVASHT